MDDAGGQIGRLGEAGGQDHAVKEDHQQGEQHAGRHGDKHVVAGGTQAAPAEAALQQGEGVLPVHLVEALRPPQPLIPGLTEGGGLLVVDHRLVAVADLLALDGAVHGELDILGEQVEGPAAVILNDPGGYQEAGARHMAVGAQQGAGEVEEPGLPQEPDGVAGGDPVGREVLGVAVAGHRIVALVKGAVHLGDKIGVHQIVRVKDEVAVIAVLPLLFESAEEVVHGVALALMYLVEALIHERARPAGRPGGVVGAVVGHHIEIQQLLWVILPVQTLQQFPDDPLLVAGGYDHGEAVQAAWLVPVLPAAADQSHHHIEALVQVEQGKQNHHSKIEMLDKFQHSHSCNPP